MRQNHIIPDKTYDPITTAYLSQRVEYYPCDICRDHLHPDEFDREDVCRECESRITCRICKVIDYDLVDADDPVCQKCIDEGLDEEGNDVEEDVNRFTRALLFAALIILAVFVIAFSIFITPASASESNVDMDAIAMIESSGCKQLYGYDGLSLGCHQMTKPALADVNQFYGKNYKFEDLLDEDVSLETANLYINKVIPRYLRAWKIPDTPINRCIAYNRGPGKFKKWYRSGADTKKLPKITQRYIQKYERLTSK
jgi:hypothetical protein